VVSHGTSAELQSSRLVEEIYLGGGEATSC
jgi:hypothetical protein